MLVLLLTAQKRPLQVEFTVGRRSLQPSPARLATLHAPHRPHSSVAGALPSTEACVVRRAASLSASLLNDEGLPSADLG